MKNMKRKFWILFLFLALITSQISNGLNVEVCGDNLCEGDETSYNCPEDCSMNLYGQAILEKNPLIFGICFLILVIIILLFIQIRKRR